MAYALSLDFALSFVAVAVVARLVTAMGCREVFGEAGTIGQNRRGRGWIFASRAPTTIATITRDESRDVGVSAPGSGEHAPVRLLGLWPTLGRTEGRASCAEAAIAGVADGNGDGAAERGVTRNGG